MGIQCLDYLAINMLVGARILKIKQEGAPGVMIIPLRNTQFWFPMMVSLLQDFPVILPPNILALPFNQDQQHPLYSKINETAGSSFISKSLRHPNIPPEITDVILELWRPTTTSRYESVLRRWYSFAISRNENPYSPEVTAVLAFLHGMYRYGCLYSGLCAARSALSSSITIKGYLKLSDHPLISRYLKDIQ